MTFILQNPSSAVKKHSLALSYANCANCTNFKLIRLESSARFTNETKYLASAIIHLKEMAAISNPFDSFFSIHYSVFSMQKEVIYIFLYIFFILEIDFILEIAQKQIDYIKKYRE